MIPTDTKTCEGGEVSQWGYHDGDNGKTYQAEVVCYSGMRM